MIHPSSYSKSKVLSNFVALLCCMTCLIIVLARLEASSSYLGDVNSDWR